MFMAIRGGRGGGYQIGASTYDDKPYDEDVYLTPHIVNVCGSPDGHPNSISAIEEKNVEGTIKQNHMIESKDIILDGNRFSSIPIPNHMIPGINGTADNGDSEVLEKVYEEVVMDVKKTFFNGELDEEVYMNQPQGFIMPGDESKLWKDTLMQTGSATLKTILQQMLGILAWESCYLMGFKEANLHHNVITLAKAYRQIYIGKSRHFGGMHSIVRELFMNEMVSVEFLRSQQNLADHLTKGLDRDLV
ncbi:zinc finger, CCHC-type containing protein [Tanacetum coccineum]